MDSGPHGWRRPWMPAASTEMRSRWSFRWGNRCGPKPSSGRWTHSEENRLCGASFPSPRGRTTSAFWTDPSNGRRRWCCGSMVGHPNLRRIRWLGGRPFGAGSGWPMASGGAFSMRPGQRTLRLAGFGSTGKANRLGSGPCLRGSARACPSGLLGPLTISVVARAAIACRREWALRFSWQEPEGSRWEPGRRKTGIAGFSVDFRPGTGSRGRVGRRYIGRAERKAVLPPPNQPKDDHGHHFRHQEWTLHPPPGGIVPGH